jgi:hypothetical protein
MFHALTMGHLDVDAVGRGKVIVLRPLEPDVVERLVHEFGNVDECGQAWVGNLPVRFQDGFLTCPWPGTQHPLVEDFARRLQAATGCLVADVQHRHIVKLDSLRSSRQDHRDQTERPPQPQVG